MIKLIVLMIMMITILMHVDEYTRSYARAPLPAAPSSLGAAVKRRSLWR